MPTRMERIRDRVRELTGKNDFSRYSEINRAYRKICLITKFNWLEENSQTLLKFTQGRTDYYLDMTRMRRMLRIFVLNTENEEEWQLMEEVPPLLFEQKVRENRDLDGNDEQDTPYCYRFRGTIISIVPTPDRSYAVRVDYIRHEYDLGEGDEPKSPEVYDDTIAELAAGYVLEISKDAAEMALADRYIARALSEFEDVVKDSHPNRTFDIDRRETRWMR